jgi:hypothetical protein
VAIRVNKNSAWPLNKIQAFLETQVSPIRIAINNGDFPLIASLWFELDEAGQQLVCASHKSSKLVQNLELDNRCAFEVATNDAPYKGVRGVGSVELTQVDVEKVLPRLADRFLKGSNPQLVNWLSSRLEDEYLLRVKPQWISSWDYSSRMKA